MKSNLQRIRARDVSEEDFRSVSAITWLAWPSAGSTLDEVVDRLRGKLPDEEGPAEQVPEYALLKVGELPVAMSVTFARKIDTPRGGLTVMALAGVACIESYRGNGFGRAVVEAAFERVRDGSFDVSLFQTSSAVRPFYEKLGCSAVENPTVNSLNQADPEARPWWDTEVMIYPAHAAAWPDGQIDLCGPGW